MGLFDRWRRKPAQEETSPETLILPQEPEDTPAPPTEIVSIPNADASRRLRMTFCSKGKLTDTFSEDTLIREVLERMQEQGILSVPIEEACVYAYPVNTTPDKRRKPWQKIGDIPNLWDDMTVYVMQEPKELSLTFRDSYSGKSLTVTVEDIDTPVRTLERMAEEMLLSIPPYKAGILLDGSVLYYNRWDQFRDIPGLRSGMTLTVDLKLPQEPRLLESGAAKNLRKEYPLVFFRKYQGACIQRIDFICYGYEEPYDILQRMYQEGMLQKEYGNAYTYVCHPEGMSEEQLNALRRNPYHEYRKDHNFLNWPLCSDGFGDPNCEYPSNDRRLVCELDPRPGTVFIIEETDATNPPPLYGCPRADMPIQTAALQTRRVDVVSF